ncbi:MAG: VPLPA-CTERM sorting domain-containing protein [Gammaproteobacteria bacterium]|nr:VPLPA-CTERM sorting domain-containing protein [Gammaproteobacteria bacterium]
MNIKSKLLTIIALVISTSANSAMVTYRLQGVMDFSAEPLLPVGASYSAALSFDPTNLTATPGAFGGISYSSASFSFTSGAVVLSGNDISITIDDNGTNSGGDWMKIDGFLEGSFLSSMRINLVRDDGSLFSSNEFPNVFPTLVDFDFGQLVINTTTTTNTASLDLFEPVPLPAAVWLFGSGLIGLIGVARRKAHV